MGRAFADHKRRKALHSELYEQDNGLLLKGFAVSFVAPIVVRRFGPCPSTLCCAVLCYAMLCYAVLWLCCAVLCAAAFLVRCVYVCHHFGGGSV